MTITAGRHRIRVRLVDWCKCPGKAIDLYHDVWLALGRPNRVTVRW